MNRVTREKRLQHILSRTSLAGSCLEYLGCVQANGYSRITVDRKTDYGHRHVYRLAFGPIPAGADICHSCDNRKCINPDHLFVGSRLDNVRDCAKKRRLSRGAKHTARIPQGERHHNSKLNNLAVLEIRDSSESRDTLANKFGVSISTIGLIQRNVIWRHV